MVTKLVQVATAAALVTFVAVFVYAWASAPDAVPAQFDGRGNPVAWGSRNLMWWTLIGTALAAGATLALSFFPCLYNFPWELTDENRERQHRLAETMIAFIALCVVITGLLITLAQVNDRPNTLILGVTWATGTMIVGVAAYFVAAWRAR
jgi:hypothetical protein